MKGLDCLVINTYGGSLLVGAELFGIPVRGSYEDAGYGIPIQQENFPRLNYIKERKDWPSQSLSSTVVIAHPPCAAFSSMNNTGQKGVDAAKFQCTIGVLDYAMHHGAPAIAIESVVGAYEGARLLHDTMARKHGYEVYRYLENSITYAVPQWRKRFWCMFFKKGAIKHEFFLAHEPKFKSVGEMMDEAEPGLPIEKLEEQWRLNKEKLHKTLDYNATRKMLSGELGFGLLPVLAAQHCMKKPTRDRKKLATRYHWDGGGFQCFWLKVLDPTMYAPTLLASSWWGCRGRSLYEDEYKACMGFPRKYIFPGRFRPKMREFLSRGVCPPIAAHVLETMCANLLGCSQKGTMCSTVEPGGTVDFRIQAKQWKNL
jgi:site-specific DNA-cytosine methylase